MPSTNIHILNSVKVSIAAVVPSHGAGDLPGKAVLSSLGIESTLFDSLLVRCALVLSNAQSGSVRSVYLRHQIPFSVSLSIAELASALQQALGTASAFAGCTTSTLPDNPSFSQCKVWKSGSVTCRVMLALEDWANPSTIQNGIASTRQLGSFHSLPWNVGLVSDLVNATNARQPFAPFLHERIAFPSQLPAATTTVAQWAKLVFQFRTPVTRCP